MVIRKHGKKWQCLVRAKNHRVAQSFTSKSDARKWGLKVESISKGISNYIELTKKDEETKRPENFDKKFRDPDMDKGLGALVPINKNLKK